jgi:hypothetical protein
MDEKTRAFVRDQGPVGQLARFAEVLERDAQT